MFAGVKKILKQSAAIVTCYERIYTSCHRLKGLVVNIFTMLKINLTVKIRYNFGKKNKDKRFFVLNCYQSAMGIYSMILYILPFMEYALKKKYIPVIDLRKYPMPCLQENDKFGIENAWEYYYEQPFPEYSLEEVYQSRHVIIMVDKGFPVKMPNWNVELPRPREELDRWSKIIHSYIRLDKNILRKIEEQKAKLLDAESGKEGRILGVSVRAGYRAGAMRNMELYNGHSKVPTCEDFIKIVAKKMEEWGCDRIFLACDDREYHNKFIEAFQDKCTYLRRSLAHYFENDRPIENPEDWVVEQTDKTKNELVEGYIIETYLLASCDCLYGAISGATVFSYYLNGGKYSEVETYNEGAYSGLGK